MGVSDIIDTIERRETTNIHIPAENNFFIPLTGAVHMPILASHFTSAYPIFRVSFL